MTEGQFLKIKDNNTKRKAVPIGTKKAGKHHENEIIKTRENFGAGHEI